MGNIWANANDVAADAPVFGENSRWDFSFPGAPWGFKRGVMYFGEGGTVYFTTPCNSVSYVAQTGSYVIAIHQSFLLQKCDFQSRRRRRNDRL